METINKVPIGDMWMVLDLLTGSWGDGTERWLHASRRALGKIRPAYVEVMHFHRRGDHSGSDFYVVADAVVDVLRTQGWIDGRKHWGYTDDKEMHANDTGKTMFFARLETVTTKGEREMRTGRWLREVKPIPWALPGPEKAGGSGGGSGGHGKDRATWQTEDYP